MAKEKATTVTIEHPALEPYYIIMDEHQFALHKRIPSGYVTQAKGYYTDLRRVLSRIAWLKTVECLAGETVNLLDLLSIHEQTVRSLIESLPELTAIEDGSDNR